MRFYIIGAGGLARDMLHAIEEINEDVIYENLKYKVIGFIDEDKEKIGKKHEGIEIKGDLDYLLNLQHKPHAIISIGDPRIKKKIVKKLDGRVNWINIIHPSISSPRNMNIGIGNFIYSFVNISNNVKIGNHNFLNVFSSYGHECTIGNFCTINNSVAVVQGVNMHDGCYVGANSVLHGNIDIGEGSQIGAGSIVRTDVPENVLMMPIGNNPRPIKQIPKF